VSPVIEATAKQTLTVNKYINSHTKKKNVTKLHYKPFQI